MTQWGYGWKKLYDSNWYEISILLDLSSFNKFRKKMLEKENAGPEFGLPNVFNKKSSWKLFQAITLCTLKTN